MNRGTLRLDSYLLRSILYIMLGSGGIVINYYVQPQMDLYVMNIILGSAGLLYAVAHAQRPLSVYQYHFDQLDSLKQRRAESEEERRSFLSQQSDGSSASNV